MKHLAPRREFLQLAAVLAAGFGTEAFAGRQTETEAPRVVDLTGGETAPPVPPEPIERGANGVLALGHVNWAQPWLPDLEHPGKRVPIAPDRCIDIVILGDGFLPDQKRAFEHEADQWYRRFLTYTPYRQLRGAFRVHAYWTTSSTHCLPARTSFYAFAADASVDQWDSLETRTAVYRSLDAIAPAIPNLWGSAEHPKSPIVSMLMRNSADKEPSGITRTLHAPVGSAPREVRMAMGEHVTHEFTHAFADVADEYIKAASPPVQRRQSAEISIAHVSNLDYSENAALVPWRHLAPGSAMNPDPNSVIGVLWIGGNNHEKGVWHSEARCLMNGTHDGNWDFSKTHQGVSLRDFHNFCFWCEEIIVAKTFWKTGMLDDGADGFAQWKIWETKWRPLYEQAFQVKERIAARNALNAAEHLQDAKIYERAGSGPAPAEAEGAVEAPAKGGDADPVP